MQTSINITSETTSGKKVTKSITNINPAIGNTALTTAASLFTAISDTNYTDADRINRMSLTEPYEPTIKTEPILTIEGTTITYNGDGQLFARATGDNAEYIYLNIYNNTISAKNAAGSTPTNYSGIIYASEGNNYSAKSANFTVGG